MTSEDELEELVGVSPRLTGHDVPRTDLRPLGIGDTLDASFAVYRGNFLLMLGIAALVRIPTALVGLLVTVRVVAMQQNYLDDMSGPAASPAGMMGFVVGTLLLYGLWLLVELLVVGPFLYGSLTWTAARRWLGLPASLAGAFRAAGRCWGSIVLGILMFGMGLVGAAMALYVLLIPVAVIAGIAGDSTAGLVVVVVMAVLLLGTGLLFMGLLASRFSFLLPAIITERAGGVGALGRSWRLTRGASWRTFAIVLLAVLLKTVLLAGPTTALVLVAQATDRVDPITAAVINQFAQIVSSVLVDPVLLIALTIAFFDRRVRTEALDLQLAAEARRREPVDATP